MPSHKTPHHRAIFMKMKRIERKRRGIKKIMVPQLLGTERLKKRIAEIKKRKAGLYRRFERI
jgi:hypothetical protein